MVYKWITQGTRPPNTTFTSGVLITRSNYRTKLREPAPEQADLPNRDAGVRSDEGVADL